MFNQPAGPRYDRLFHLHNHRAWRVIQARLDGLIRLVLYSRIHRAPAMQVQLGHAQAVSSRPTIQSRHPSSTMFSIHGHPQ
jgi:hypothetical protein